MSFAVSNFASAYSSHASYAPPLAEAAPKLVASPKPAPDQDLQTGSSRVTISQAGRQLLAMEAAHAAPTSAGAAVAANDTTDSAALAVRIGNLFREAGIDAGQNARITVDASGHIDVAGVGIQTSQQIRAILAQHPDIVLALRNQAA
ncbi:MAG: hypothetical protein EKK46_11130 [Rhodocyclaceae bacterium]|nr:MAG: hypothetical protein EKK46_11130 [Rhodocyclaceae bacterium]